MTDKDMCERNVFSVAVPDTTLQLCLFHTLRSFSREVTLDKMGIRVGQRDALLHIFNAMAIARCEQEFDEQCALLEEMAIPTALTYFRRKWLPIKQEWVSSYKVRHFMLSEQANNRLESLTGKIMSVSTGFASLDTFFSELFYCTPCLGWRTCPYQHSRWPLLRRRRLEHGGAIMFLSVEF